MYVLATDRVVQTLVVVVVSKGLGFLIMLPSYDNDHGRVTELFLAFSCHVDEMINNSLIIMDGRYVISLNFR